MKMPLVVGLLLCGPSPLRMIRAQGVDPNLVGEVTAVQQAMARSNRGLGGYTWTETTEVLVDGSVKTTTTFSCRAYGTGDITRTPVEAPPQENTPNPVSRRPLKRMKADMQDYIDRAISRIRTYVPPKPEQIQYLLQNGLASRGQPAGSNSEIRFTHYFEEGDSLVFTYDPVSKALLRANIASTLGNPKDPVTLEVVYETLPDGVNHVASATLNAKRKDVQVKLRNAQYQRVTN